MRTLHPDCGGSRPFPDPGHPNRSCRKDSGRPKLPTPRGQRPSELPCLLKAEVTLWQSRHLDAHPRRFASDSPPTRVHRWERALGVGPPGTSHGQRRFCGRPLPGLGRRYRWGPGPIRVARWSREPRAARTLANWAEERRPPSPDSYPLEVASPPPDKLPGPGGSLATRERSGCGSRSARPPRRRRRKDPHWRVRRAYVPTWVGEGCRLPEAVGPSDRRCARIRDR